MKKVVARWVPKILRNDEMFVKVKHAEDLAQINNSGLDFKARFVTCDETWVHHHELNTRKSGREWRGKGEKPLKRPKIA